MTAEEIIRVQFKVLAMAEDIELDIHSLEFKDFKKRIFKNIEYLEKFKED